MGRRIITTEMQAGGMAGAGGISVDKYTDKLVKYIPADIVAAWTAITGMIAGATTEPKGTLLWIAFIFGLIVTLLWTKRQTDVPDKPMAVTQIAISTVAFAVWVFALGGPFATTAWYSPLYGSLVLIGYTLIVPLVNPPEG